MEVVLPDPTVHTLSWFQNFVSHGHLWQFVEDYGTDCNAGPKAPRDIAAIMAQLGATEFPVKRTVFTGAGGRVLNRAIWFVKCRWLRWRIPNRITLFMQYPSAAWSKNRWLRVLNRRIKKKKDIRLVVLVHDLASFRRAGNAVKTCPLDHNEVDIFSLADKVIVHNGVMVAALVRRGISRDKLVPLMLFDYLTECHMDSTSSKDMVLDCSVAIAGNLDVAKSGYLKRLGELKSVQFHLYGPNFDASNITGSNITYEGCWSPEVLPTQLKGCFGLVWDGMCVETCSGAYGEYLRVNNPHKLSLYLASGLPVIVWRESAVAQFVEENRLGICIDSLSEISNAIAGLNPDRVIEMLRNVCTIGAKVRNGCFVRDALRICLEQLR